MIFLNAVGARMAPDWAARALGDLVRDDELGGSTRRRSYPPRREAFFVCVCLCVCMFVCVCVCARARVIGCMLGKEKRSKLGIAPMGLSVFSSTRRVRGRRHSFHCVN